MAPTKAAAVFVLLAAMPLLASAKVWCDFGGGKGYYAEACPAKAKAQPIDSAPLPPARWFPKIGMTAGEVWQHVTSKTCFELTPLQWCGAPKINKTERASGISEQWVFPVGYHNVYLYFDDNVLTTIQDME